MYVHPSGTSAALQFLEHVNVSQGILSSNLSVDTKSTIWLYYISAKLTV